MNVNDPKIGKLALHGVAWSVAQNWGGRAFTFVLFIVLARFLSPAQFGLVGAAAMVVMLIGLVAEFGFGDAIVQRQGYVAADANLPFFLSIATALALACTCALNAGRVEVWLEAPGLAPIVVALALVAPLSTISLFQEVNYRRAFAFRQLAFRVFIANLVAGSFAIAAALAGFGAWSLVVQTYAATLIGLIWLWSRPMWLPTFEFHKRALFELVRYGAPVVTMRLLDFAGTRFFEVILLGRYGLAVFGLYTAGARIYQTLMQLLQSALSDVSLSILSRIAHDRARMAQIYQQAILISAMVFAPIFVGCAALIPEISAVLFGARWVGVGDIARPLLLLGAVQSVQFANGPYLSARGRPELVAIAALVKSVGIILMSSVLPTENVRGLVYIFVAGQLLATPLSFGFILKELRVPAVPFLIGLFPSIIACIAADAFVASARAHLEVGVTSPLFRGMLLGSGFIAVYLLIAGALGFKQISAFKAFLPAWRNSRSRAV